MANIRDDIVAKRRARIETLGHNEGGDIPKRREVPIVPFLGEDGLICEVQRRSPSKGDIAPGLDAVEQAGRYVKAGVRNLSVLTEPEGFGGSLEDLLRVKKTFPRTSVLRKDFLFDAKDIDVAWRAGADAVLLIAGMLTEDQLHLLYRCAKGLGLEALVEVHDAADLRKAARLAPNLVGVNSRDLTTFAIDPLLPVKVRSGIDWDCKVVYESGVHHPEQAAFAAAAGFKGLLVGEAAVKSPSLPGRLLEALKTAREDRFWRAIGRRLWRNPDRPLVKVCGLAREEDARLALDLGADLLGFVLWDKSPRRADPAVVRALRDADALKVAVTVNAAETKELPAPLRELLEEGLLDAAQLHGDEAPDVCAALWPTYYKALRPSGPEDAAQADRYRCPRILLDAHAPVPGGSGTRVSVGVLEAWKRPLWLAGGITPDNVGRIVQARRPELVDVASGVEDSPGVKNADRMRLFFRELGR